MPLDYEQTVELAVGATLHVLGADEFVFEDGSHSMPLADALRRPNASTGTLTRTEKGVTVHYNDGGDIGGSMETFAYPPEDDGGWTLAEALHFGMVNSPGPGTPAAMPAAPLLPRHLSNSSATSATPSGEETEASASSAASASTSVSTDTRVRLAGMTMTVSHFGGVHNFWDGDLTNLSRDSGRKAGSKIYKAHASGNLMTVPIVTRPGPITSWMNVMIPVNLSMAHVPAYDKTTMEAVQAHYVRDTRAGKSVGEYVKLHPASTSLPPTVGRLVLIWRDFHSRIGIGWRAVVQVPVVHLADGSYGSDFVSVQVRE